MKSKKYFQELSLGEMVFINIFGEPFFNESGVVVKISPETGERENVCLASSFAPESMDDYWTVESLKLEWELSNGKVPEDSFLVPITPFVLGGEFNALNLMAIKKEEAVRYYAKICNAIAGLPDGVAVKDGEKIQIVVKKE